MPFGGVKDKDVIYIKGVEQLVAGSKPSREDYLRI